MSILDSNGVYLKNFELKHMVKYLDAGFFISNTKMLVLAIYGIFVIEKHRIISKIASIHIMEPLKTKKINESEYFVIASNLGFWYFKNDQPKFFSYVGINLIEKIDENIFLISNNKYRVEICDLSGKRLKSLNKLQMNSFASPQEIQMLKNFNLVSYFGNTLKIWGTSDFVSLGIFRLHFPFLKRVQFNDVNFNF